MFFKRKSKKQDICILPELKNVLTQSEIIDIKSILIANKKENIDYIHISNSSKHLELDMNDPDEIFIITEYKASIKKFAKTKGYYVHYIANEGRLVVLVLKNNKFILNIIY